MPVIIILGVGVVILLAFFFFGGRLTESNELSNSTPIGSNESSGQCVDLCNQWDQRRQERCLAESAAQASQRKVDNLRAQLAIALVMATALGVAAYIASLIPLYGWIAAAILGVAAAAAFLAADFIAGKLTIADGELGAAEMNASKGRNSEAEARTLLITKCPEQSAACLSRPSPC